MLFFGIASVLWAITYGMNAQVLQSIDPLLMSGFFIFSGLILFIPFAKKPHFRVHTKLQLMLIGSIQWGLMYLFLQQAFSRLSGHLVALTCLTTPIYISLIADIYAHQWHKKRLLLAFAAVGLTISATRFNGNYDTIPWKGIFFGEMANICYAWGQILYKRWKSQHSTVKEHLTMFWMYAGATFVILLACVGQLNALTYNAIKNIPWDAQLIWKIIFLGPIACGFGNYIWNKGIPRVSTTILLIFNNLSIPLGILFSGMFFGETVHWERLWVALLGFFILLASDRRISRQKTNFSTTEFTPKTECLQHRKIIS